MEASTSGRLMPVLGLTASPSPARIKHRLTAVSKPGFTSASVPALRLPQELFAVATSRASLQDTSFLKAVDELQHAATKLEAERARLSIQGQELHIWDMARDEEIALLQAENEHLERQFQDLYEKVGKGLAHDAVLESLQFALRKARAERDAEVTEADKLFNALQQHQAAAQELQALHSTFSQAVISLAAQQAHTMPTATRSPRMPSSSSRPAQAIAQQATLTPQMAPLGGGGREDGSDEADINRDRTSLPQLLAMVKAGTADPTTLAPQDMAVLLQGLMDTAAAAQQARGQLQALQAEHSALEQILSSTAEERTALQNAYVQLQEQQQQQNLQQGQQLQVSAHLQQNSDAHVVDAVMPFGSSHYPSGSPTVHSPPTAREAAARTVAVQLFPEPSLKSFAELAAMRTSAYGQSFSDSDALAGGAAASAEDTIASGGVEAHAVDASVDAAVDAAMLQRMLAAREAECSTLRDKLEQYKQYLQDNQDEVSSMQVELLTARDSAHALQAKLHAQALKVRQLQQQNTHLLRQVQEHMHAAQQGQPSAQRRQVLAGEVQHTAAPPPADCVLFDAYDEADSVAWKVAQIEGQLARMRDEAQRHADHAQHAQAEAEQRSSQHQAEAVQLRDEVARLQQEAKQVLEASASERHMHEAQCASLLADLQAAHAQAARLAECMRTMEQQLANAGQQLKESAARSVGLERQLAQLESQHAFDTHQKEAEGAALSAHLLAKHAIDLVLLRAQDFEHLEQQQAQHRALLAGHGAEHAAALGRLHQLHAQQKLRARHNDDAQKEQLDQLCETQRRNEELYHELEQLQQAQFAPTESGEEARVQAELMSASAEFERSKGLRLQQELDASHHAYSLLLEQLHHAQCESLPLAEAFQQQGQQSAEVGVTLRGRNYVHVGSAQLDRSSPQQTSDESPALAEDASLSEGEACLEQLPHALAKQMQHALHADSTGVPHVQLLLPSAECQLKQEPNGSSRYGMNKEEAHPLAIQAQTQPKQDQQDDADVNAVLGHLHSIHTNAFEQQGVAHGSERSRDPGQVARASLANMPHLFLEPKYPAEPPVDNNQFINQPLQHLPQVHITVPDAPLMDTWCWADVCDTSSEASQGGGGQDKAPTASEPAVQHEQKAASQLSPAIAGGQAAHTWQATLPAANEAHPPKLSLADSTAVCSVQQPLLQMRSAAVLLGTGVLGHAAVIHASSSSNTAGDAHGVAVIASSSNTGLAPHHLLLLTTDLMLEQDKNSSPMNLCQQLDHDSDQANLRHKQEASSSGGHQSSGSQRSSKGDGGDGGFGWPWANLPLSAPEPPTTWLPSRRSRLSYSEPGTGQTLLLDPPSSVPKLPPLVGHGTQGPRSFSASASSQALCSQDNINAGMAGVPACANAAQQAGALLASQVGAQAQAVAIAFTHVQAHPQDQVQAVPMAPVVLTSLPRARSITDAMDSVSTSSDYDPDTELLAPDEEDAPEALLEELRLASIAQAGWRGGSSISAPVSPLMVQGSGIPAPWLAQGSFSDPRVNSHAASKRALAVGLHAAIAEGTVDRSPSNPFGISASAPVSPAGAGASTSARTGLVLGTFGAGSSATGTPDMCLTAAAAWGDDSPQWPRHNAHPHGDGEISSEQFGEPLVLSLALSHDIEHDELQSSPFIENAFGTEYQLAQGSEDGQHQDQHVQGDQHPEHDVEGGQYALLSEDDEYSEDCSSKEAERQEVRHTAAAIFDDWQGQAEAAEPPAAVGTAAAAAAAVQSSADASGPGELPYGTHVDTCSAPWTVAWPDADAVTWRRPADAVAGTDAGSHAVQDMHAESVGPHSHRPALSDVELKLQPATSTTAGQAALFSAWGYTQPHDDMLPWLHASGTQAAPQSPSIGGSAHMHTGAMRTAGLDMMAACQDAVVAMDEGESANPEGVMATPEPGGSRPWAAPPSNVDDAWSASLHAEGRALPYDADEGMSLQHEYTPPASAGLVHLDEAPPILAPQRAAESSIPGTSAVEGLHSPSSLYAQQPAGSMHGADDNGADTAVLTEGAGHACAATEQQFGKTSTGASLASGADMAVDGDVEHADTEAALCEALQGLQALPARHLRARGRALVEQVLKRVDRLGSYLHDLNDASQAAEAGLPLPHASPTSQPAPWHYPFSSMTAAAQSSQQSNRAVPLSPVGMSCSGTTLLSCNDTLTAPMQQRASQHSILPGGMPAPVSGGMGAGPLSATRQGQAMQGHGVPHGSDGLHNTFLADAPPITPTSMQAPTSGEEHRAGSGMLTLLASGSPHASGAAAAPVALGVVSVPELLGELSKLQRDLKRLSVVHTAASRAGSTTQVPADGSVRSDPGSVQSLVSSGTEERPMGLLDATMHDGMAATPAPGMQPQDDLSRSVPNLQQFPDQSQAEQPTATGPLEALVKPHRTKGLSALPTLDKDLGAQLEFVQHASAVQQSGPQCAGVALETRQPERPGLASHGSSSTAASWFRGSLSRQQLQYDAAQKGSHAGLVGLSASAISTAQLWLQPEATGANSTIGTFGADEHVWIPSTAAQYYRSSIPPAHVLPPQAGAPNTSGTTALESIHAAPAIAAKPLPSAFKQSPLAHSAYTATAMSSTQEPPWLSSGAMSGVVHNLLPLPSDVFNQAAGSVTHRVTTSSAAVSPAVVQSRNTSAVAASSSPLRLAAPLSPSELAALPPSLQLYAPTGLRHAARQLQHAVE